MGLYRLILIVIPGFVFGSILIHEKSFRTHWILLFLLNVYEGIWVSSLSTSSYTLPNTQKSVIVILLEKRPYSNSALINCHFIIILTQYKIFPESVRDKDDCSLCFFLLGKVPGSIFSFSFFVDIKFSSNFFYFCMWNFNIFFSQVNKPYLPLASGEYSLQTGVIIVSSFAILVSLKICT